jgi:hypothetical protein
MLLLVKAWSEDQAFFFNNDVNKDPVMLNIPKQRLNKRPKK